VSRDAPVSSAAAHYLVTGLPSLLARRIVEQILGFEPRAFVHSLVHQDDVDVVGQFLAGLDAQQRARIRVLSGDPVALDWGLSGSEYVDLAKRVNRAHFVVHPRDLKSARAPESQGALLGREIVQFVMKAGELESAVVYSALSVSGDRSGTVGEGELVSGQSFKRADDQALAMMELMVRRRLDDFPFVIVRPGHLAGDSQTGEFERETAMGRLLEAVVELKPSQAVRVVRARTPAYVVATDFVARAAYYLGRLAQARNKTIQLTEGHPRSLQNLVHVLLELSGHEGERLDASLDPRLGVTQAQLTRASQDVGSPNVFYDTMTAQTLLSPSGISCPPLEDYADKLVTFARTKNAR